MLVTSRKLRLSWKLKHECKWQVAHKGVTVMRSCLRWNLIHPIISIDLIKVISVSGYNSC